MTVQSTPRRSIAKQAATARRLNACCTIAQHVLDATVEIEDTRTIIHKPGRYGELFFVESPRFTGRYYPVNYRAGTWSCDAQNAAYFIGLAQQYVQVAQ